MCQFIISSAFTDKLEEKEGKGSKGATPRRIDYLWRSADDTHCKHGNLAVHLRTNTNIRTETARQTFTQRDTDIETSCHYEASWQTIRSRQNCKNFPKCVLKKHLLVGQPTMLQHVSLLLFTKKKKSALEAWNSSLWLCDIIPFLTLFPYSKPHVNISLGFIHIYIMYITIYTDYVQLYRA